MSDNPLVHSLSQSVQADSFSEAIKHLWSAQHILSSADSSSLLNLKVSTFLNRLLSKYSSQIFLPLSRTYLMICKIVEKVHSPFLIKLANDILLLCEEIKGTQMAEELNSALQELLEKLVTLGLEPDQLEVVEGLRRCKDFSRFESTFLSICNGIVAGQVSSAHDLFDCLSSFEKFSDQIELFIEKIPQISESLSKTNNVEVIKKSLTLLEHFIFKFNYTIQINDQTETFTSHLVHKLPKTIISGVLSIINTIIPYEASISQHILPILQRLWQLFPYECDQFFDSTRMLLSAISNHGSSDFKFRASGFLYEILNSPSMPSTLKTSLESDGELNSLRANEGFAPTSGILESEQITKLEDLQPVIGMPMTATIPAGNDYTYHIEVIEANSILSWGFATRDYDINFEVKRIDLPTPQSIIKQDYIQCSELPFVKSLLINSPGLYQFTWSNKYSWFNEKIVRFRIVVLAPYHKTNTTEKDIHKVIEILCNDEVPSNSNDLLEVAVLCKSKVVSLHALGIKEEIPDLDVNAIQGFINRVKGNNKFAGVKVGIVSKQPKQRNELKNLKAVFMSRDVDALALFNESEIHCDTLVCVVVEDGIRSSVVHRGKVLVDSNGRPIGDLSRTGVTDITTGISNLLSLFGPCCLILSGSESPSLSTLMPSLKDLVPSEILQESLIRGPIHGADSLIQSASKLHLLNQKYKINH